MVGAGLTAVLHTPSLILAIVNALTPWYGPHTTQERGEPPPGRPGGCVGYHVRLDAATTRDTRLTFCTTGVLLRRLSGDPLLRTTSHVVVDEVWGGM
eukprot:145965-Chlamydomonas_euryale.AAC.4